MTRLTTTSDKGGLAFTFDLDIICDKSEMMKIVELGKRLKYYEDLEESGLLIKLPYPVGTPLFIPCRKQGVKQDHIRRWQTNNKGLMFCSNGSFYLADAIGKSIFLTREEAESKLKESRQ